MRERLRVATSAHSVVGSCRQNVPAVDLESHRRKPVATGSASIKQIEITRVLFGNHPADQMDTSLIQKENSIDR
ncbi:MAG: hypothetical protein ABR607_00645 [Pyrinomonadaceae bacterium]